tara:strand:+ start:230 stop:943 length:714 start_codon:yes stop_codon:yes gene_type:complete
MKILDTETGKQLVAKVGVKKARKLIQQNMFSQAVEKEYGQKLSGIDRLRKIQTRQIAGPRGRSTPGTTDSLRYADLSKKNPRLAQVMGESFGAPMKQKRAERVMKIYRKRLSSKSRDDRSFNTGDFDKAFRSSQIRKGKGPKVRIPTSPEGGAKNPENIRTFLGVDRPSTPEQGEEGIMGTIRANISAEMKRRAGKTNPLDLLRSTLNKTITIRGEREQRLAAKHGSKARRRGKSNQ